MNFGVLVRHEPRLLELLNEASAVKGKEKYFCANRLWHKDFKPRMEQMVGMHLAKNAPAIMRTSKAYDCAYDTLYSVLPDCKHPGEIC